MSTTKPDDLQAVRDIVEALQPFDELDRDRIVRWAREKLGMSHSPSVTATSAPAIVSGGAASPPATDGGQDISSFVTKKDPKSDVHFAATVAYYYQFVAPTAERKAAITKEDLIDACRKAPRKRPKRPAQVLVNVYHDGLLDRGERGHVQVKLSR